MSEAKNIFRLEIKQSELLLKLLQWGKQFKHFALYPGNGYVDKYHRVDLVFGAGTKRVISPPNNHLNNLEKEWQSKPSWLFGYFGYDVKNEIELLSSNNFDGVDAPTICFFEPEITGFLQDEFLHIIADDPEKIFKEILNTKIFEAETLPKLNFTSRFSKEDYMRAAIDLQQHIQMGNIYEVNFCQEFFAEAVKVDVFSVFHHLNEKAHPPFAAFLNMPNHAVMCASPERYLQKENKRLISQPIKGTAKRSQMVDEDVAIAQALKNSTKERAENVMIVDLVRNDLSKVASNGSVQVPELFGVHTFPTVHQLISTVQAELRPDKTWVDAIRATYPMGSMTGAPKVRAMQLIEQYERHKRGIYSGAIGYVSPQGDFDFNVVIRSLLYNKNSHYLSLSVGSALTILADVEQEYVECFLKAEALLGLFKE